MWRLVSHRKGAVNLVNGRLFNAKSLPEPRMAYITLETTLKKLD